jgi:hypothetical protein
MSSNDKNGENEHHRQNKGKSSQRFVYYNFVPGHRPLFVPVAAAQREGGPANNPPGGQCSAFLRGASPISALGKPALPHWSNSTNLMVLFNHWIH